MYLSQVRGALITQNGVTFPFSRDFTPLSEILLAVSRQLRGAPRCPSLYLPRATSDCALLAFLLNGTQAGAQ